MRLLDDGPCVGPSCDVNAGQGSGTGGNYGQIMQPITAGGGSSSAIAGVIAAAAIIAGLLFVIWTSRKVAAYFGGESFTGRSVPNSYKKTQAMIASGTWTDRQMWNYLKYGEERTASGKEHRGYSAVHDHMMAKGQAEHDAEIAAMQAEREIAEFQAQQDLESEIERNTVR